MRRLSIDPLRPDPATLAQAADAVRAGGIVALPTDTVYGLAVDPFSATAVQRLFAAKGRELSRALPLIAADLAQLESVLGSLPPLGRLLAEQFWPGPLTILIKAPKTIPHDVSGGTGRVGGRVPEHAVARGCAARARRVLTATSANLSGQPATDQPDDLVSPLGSCIDVLLDAGKTRGGPPSTIVDVSGDDVILRRSGLLTGRPSRHASDT